MALAKLNYSLNYYKVNKIKKSDIYIIEDITNLDKTKILRYYSVSACRLKYNIYIFTSNKVS